MDPEEHEPINAELPSDCLQVPQFSSVPSIEFRNDPEKFREDLMNIARTTLSSKLLTQHKDFFAKMAVDAVVRLKGSGNLEAIQVCMCAIVSGNIPHFYIS